MQQPIHKASYHNYIYFLILIFLTTLACDPCVGKTGSDLEECEVAENAPSSASPADDADGTERSCPLVFAESFEDRDAEGDWQVDNTEGAKDGVNAAHPPALRAGDTATLTFDCDGEEHTQLSFWWNQIAGQNASCCNALPTEKLGLDLLVDGEARATFGRAGGWQQAVISVEPGLHTYTFVARTEQDTFSAGGDDPTPPFLLDSFVCRSVSPEPGVNERVDFDRCFVPIEVSGDWFVDSTQGTQAGEAAIHPPPLSGGDERAMTFDCNGVSHTQFRFSWNQTAGQNASCCNALPTTELALDLEVDGEHRETFGRAGGWRDVIVNVPEGQHEYTFIARSEDDTLSAGSTDPTPPFVLDSFACVQAEPTVAVNGRVDFDDGFVPIETAGDWFVDNTRGTQDGEAAVHPPAMTAGQERTLTLDCGGAEHSTLSFFWNQIAGQNASCCNALPTEELAFDVLVDGNDPRTFGNAGGWQKAVIEVPSGTHTYTFTARTGGDTFAAGSTDPTPPFVIDSIVCD